MRMYFDFYGDFKKVDLEECCFGAIEFDCKGKHYIVDVTGEVDFDREDGYFGGRIKGDIEHLTFDGEEPIPEKELGDIILDMDTSTFRYNILDDGKTLDYKLLKVLISVNEKSIQFELSNGEKEEEENA